MFIKLISEKGFVSSTYKELLEGVPIMGQWLMNPNRNREVAGSIPGLAQWVKDPAVP